MKIVKKTIILKCLIIDRGNFTNHPFRFIFLSLHSSLIQNLLVHKLFKNEENQSFIQNYMIKQSPQNFRSNGDMVYKTERYVVSEG